MAQIQFFEKPKCINGEKQKNILKKAGNDIECINILEYPWNSDELAPFIKDKQPTDFMNYTAPKIKNGDIVPEELDYDAAVSLMVKEPILIKRPLIKVDGMSIQGFHDKRLIPYLGSWDGREDVITCPNLQTISCDESAKTK